jgi:hypothetical protein
MPKPNARGVEFQLWSEYLAQLSARKADVERQANEDRDLQRLLLCFDALALRGVSLEQAARTASVLVAGLTINQRDLRS